MSGSLIFNHMQALDEGRLGDNASGQGGGGVQSPQMSTSHRQGSVLNVRTLDDEMSFKELPGRATSLVITEEEQYPQIKQQ